MAACNPVWRPLTPIPEDTTLGKGQMVHVWTKAGPDSFPRRYRWSAVRIPCDSISGVPYSLRHGEEQYAQRVKGDTARHSVPRYLVQAVEASYLNPVNRWLMAADIAFIIGYTMVTPCHDPLGCTEPDSPHRRRPGIGPRGYALRPGPERATNRGTGAGSLPVAFPAVRWTFPRVTNGALDALLPQILRSIPIHRAWAFWSPIRQPVLPGPPDGWFSHSGGNDAGQASNPDGPRGRLQERSH